MASKNQDFQPFFHTHQEKIYPYIFGGLCVLFGIVLTIAAISQDSNIYLVGLAVIMYLIGLSYIIYGLYSYRDIDVGYTSSNSKETISVRATSCLHCKGLCYCKGICVKYYESSGFSANNPFDVAIHPQDGSTSAYGIIQLIVDKDNRKKNINCEKVSTDEAKKVKNKMENELKQAIRNKTVLTTIYHPK